MPFYEAGRREAQAQPGEAASKAGSTFDQGVERLVAAVLASPEFLYRAIRGPEGTKPNTEFALTDLELASRLSFFLWSSGPDDELLNLAISNGLSKPGVLDAQVKRMLSDPRASTLVSSFAMKWLSLDDLDIVKPDPKIFGQFNDALREDFSREAESFISSILLENRSVVDLLTARQTFVNNRLAQHYGIEGVSGPQFRKIDLTDESRFGLLGKAAVLMRTSYPTARLRCFAAHGCWAGFRARRRRLLLQTSRQICPSLRAKSRRRSGRAWSSIATKRLAGSATA